MVKKLLLRLTKPFITALLFFAFSNETGAQCAGADNTVTVCNKDADVSTRNFDLFANLSGTPTAGGTWSSNSPVSFFALDINTGIVDLWRVNNYGSHTFTYTNPACNQSATVTVRLGGYPGEDNIDGSANACSDNTSVNLHSFIGSDTTGKVQDFNGQWAEVPVNATGLLFGSSFDAFSAGPGVYTFTYTVGAVDTCLSRTVTLELEVHPAAESGLPSNLVVCTTDDLSSLTAVNLNNQLFGEDTDGTWSEGITNQIDDFLDNTINVEEINTNFGYGTYSFTYTVLPSNPICSIKTSTVDIIILPTLSGSLTPNNYCLGATPYEISLTYDDTIFPNGTYDISYRVGSGPGAQIGVSSTSLSNGQGLITVDSSLVSVNQFLSFSIIGLVGTNPLQDVCPSIDVPPVSFIVSDPQASATSVCFAEDAVIDLSNILDSAGAMTNETYDITYDIISPSNNRSTLTAQNISFISGSGSFTIPANELPESGTYTIETSIPNGLNLNCTVNTELNVIPIPDAIALGLVLDNNCDATRIDVTINAPALANGSYIVTYEVLEQNSSSILISNTIGFTGGQASYLVDITTLPEGNYTVALRSTQNDTTPCRSVFDFELIEAFAIGGIPDDPELAASNVLCVEGYPPNGPTLADVPITATGIVTWYENETTTTPLASTTLLVDGGVYYATNTDPNNSCESSNRVRTSIDLVFTDVVTITNANPIFCSLGNPTVADLDASANNGGMVVWYDAPTNGNLLDNSTVLENGNTYYAAESNGNCESDTRLQLTVTIINPPIPQLSDQTTDLCGINELTLDDLQQDITLQTGFDIVWYDAPTEGNALDLSEILINEVTYYAGSIDPTTGCESNERLAVLANLNNCDPEDYGFFVPDGFSPNSDGRNDTFKITNIEFIFPAFDLEIYNRYGQLLYKGNKNSPAWNGKSNQSGSVNAIAPNGVYFYVLNYNREGFKPKQGRLYLNR